MRVDEYVKESWVTFVLRITMGWFKCDEEEV